MNTLSTDSSYLANESWFEQKTKYGDKKAIEKAIQLSKREIKAWQDFLIDCYKKLEKITERKK